MFFVKNRNAENPAPVKKENRSKTFILFTLKLAHAISKKKNF